jgi:hypothetical protein
LNWNIHVADKVHQIKVVVFMYPSAAHSSTATTHRIIDALKLILLFFLFFLFLLITVIEIFPRI